MTSARLVDPDPEGVVERRELVAADRSELCPCVVVGEQTPVDPQAQTTHVLHLALVSGTRQDGVWQGSFLVGAASAGEWSVTGSAAGDLTRTQPGPFDDNLVEPKQVLATAPPSVRVSGADWPVLTLTLPRRQVRVGRAYVLSGTATYQHSGQPAAGLRLSVRHTFCAAEDGYGGTELAAVRTNADGRWQVRSRVPAGNWCVWLASVPAAWSREPGDHHAGLLAGRAHRGPAPRPHRRRRLAGRHRDRTAGAGRRPRPLGRRGLGGRRRGGAAPTARSS